MKKNFLFKGVSVLGAMLLLANVALPGMVAYAEGEQQQLQDQQQGQQQGGQEQQGEQQQGQQQGGQEQQGGEQGGNEGGQDAEPEVETCTTTKGNNVAQIGECYYETLKAAIEAAQSEDIITLVTNITENVEISKDVNLSLENNKITGQIKVSEGNVKISGGEISHTTFTLYVKGNSAKVNVENSKISASSGRAIRVEDGGELVIGGDDTVVEAIEESIGTRDGGKNKVTINGGTYTSTDNCVVMTNGTSGMGDNEIKINGGTFNGNITSNGYIACGVYVANSDNVEINGGTFNIKDGVGVVSRGGTTKLSDDVTFNFSYYTIAQANIATTKGKVGDSRVVVPVGKTLVMDVAANYPGATTFNVENELGETVVIAGSSNSTNTYTVKYDENEDNQTVKLTKNSTTAEITEPEVPVKEGKTFAGWYNGENSFNFAAGISSNVTLESKWAEPMVINSSSIKEAKTIDEGRDTTNQGKFGFDWDSESKTVTITDKNLVSYKGGNDGDNETSKWLGLIVDFGVPVTTAQSSDSTTYNIEQIDRNDADVYGGNTESTTDFIIWINEKKDGKKIKFVNQVAPSEFVEVKFVFKTLDESVVNFKKLTISTDATDTYIDKIKANDEKFTLSYDKDSKELSIMDNGLAPYDNGHGNNKWIGILADFGTEVKGTGTEGDYGVEDVDRTDAARWGAKGTEFVMWLSDARNNTDITLKKSTSSYNDDSITFKLLFKKTVTFESNGGSTVAAQPVIMGEAAKKPADPTRSGYTFKGWYADKDLKTEYKFTEKVNDNITLYAKWEQKSSGGSSSGGGGGSSRSSTTKTTTTTTGDAKTTTDTKVTDTKTNVDGNNNGNTPAYNNDFSKEFNDAYQFAYKNGITTMPSIEEADMYGPLTRIAMAKMLSQYAINVLGKTPDTSVVVPTFPDVDAKLDADYNNGVTLAYQLGIMGINVNKYRPFDLVTRAEFGTALSRMLYGLSDGEGDQWYKTHLDKLMEEQIITNNNPNLQELRGYVMIMLMRSA